MTTRQYVSAGIGLVVALALFSSGYTVREWEQVIITQFGKPKGEPVTEAGLHFKLPWMQQVNRFDKRILIWHPWGAAACSATGWGNSQAH